MIPDGTPVGPLAKLIPLVTLSAKESRTALLDNTEEAACTIDFVDDFVNTQNIKVCTEQTFAPTANFLSAKFFLQLLIFSIKIDTPGSIVTKKFLDFVHKEERSYLVHCCPAHTEQSLPQTRSSQYPSRQR